MSEQLKPCPFCGSPARLNRSKGESLWSHDQVEWTQVQCTNEDCGVATENRCEGWEPEPVESWNTRALTTSPPAQTEREVCSDCDGNGYIDSWTVDGEYNPTHCESCDGGRKPATQHDEDDGDITGQPGPLPETGWDDAPSGAFRKPSPTAGMNLGERIKHVGGRENAAGYIEFGSVMAVRALVRQYLRDLPAPQQATPTRATREAEQRARMQARLAARHEGKATADFDLPAQNDAPQQATPEPVQTIIRQGFTVDVSPETVARLQANRAAFIAELEGDTPEPLTLGPLAKRNIYDAIREAYDLGYNDARNARTVPGDSAPGYDGRSVEEDHGGALFNTLSKRLTPATPEPETCRKRPRCGRADPCAWLEKQATQQAAGEPVGEVAAESILNQWMAECGVYLVEKMGHQWASQTKQADLLYLVEKAISYTHPAPGVPAKLPSAYATSTEDGTWRVLLAFDNKDDAEATRRFLHDHGVQPRTMRSTAPGVPEGFALVQSPITEAMHEAACKVLIRSTGMDGLPQRMLDALAAAQAKGAQA